MIHDWNGTLADPEVLERALDYPAHLGLAKAHPGIHDVVIVSMLLGRTCVALMESDIPEAPSASGVPVPKTRKRSQVERARADIMLRILAALPSHPFGCGLEEVERYVRRYLYRGELGNIEFSQKHRLDY